MHCFDHKVSMTLKLDRWRTEPHLRAFERELEEMRAAHEALPPTHRPAPAGWRLFGWLRKRLA